MQPLLFPDDRAAREIATSAEELARCARTGALRLHRLCHGDLAGIFDWPTTCGLDLDADMVVLDLSALYPSDALGLLMLCATAWLQASPTSADYEQE